MSRSPPIADLLRRSLATAARPSRWPRVWRWHWRRVVRLPGTARSVAAGAALGCLVSFTPLIGGRIVIAAALAALLRISPVAAVAGTHVGNPLFYPLIFVVSVELGLVLLGRPGLGPIDLGRLAELALPAALGLAVAGSLTSLAVYAVVLRGVRAYQEKHRARLVAARRRGEAASCRTRTGVRSI